MADTSTWSHQDLRALFDRMSEHVGDWQGLPIMLGEDTPLVLAKGHPYHDLYRELKQTDDAMVEVEVIVGGPSGPIPPDERVVNSWFSRVRNCQVYVLDGGGRRYAATRRVSPDRSMDRLTFWLRTIGATDAWDLTAEARARETLRAMLSERQWEHYDLTGSFLETSPRSRVTYLFRRLRPTIALSPRGRNGTDDVMRCLAVLCLHPIGYYAQSWGGCMVPSDDVMAHLAWMRGDEAGYWKAANQHEPSAPEAGI